MAAHAGRHGGHPHLVGAGRQDRPVIIVSKKAVGRALQVHDIVRMGADAAQEAEAGLDEKRCLNESLRPEIMQAIEVACVVAFELVAGAGGVQRLQRVADVLEARSEEHTSELQSLMRISSAVFCLKQKTSNNITRTHASTSI